jgi:hypothetical protein
MYDLVELCIYAWIRMYLQEHKYICHCEPTCGGKQITI